MQRLPTMRLVVQELERANNASQHYPKGVLQAFIDGDKKADSIIRNMILNIKLQLK